MARVLATEGEVLTVAEKDLELPIPADPDVVYTLKPISLEHSRAIIKRHTKTVPRRGRNDDVVDTEQVHRQLLDECLVGWTGVIAQGQPVACVTEQKHRLPAVIQFALIERAQAGQIGAAEQQAASFREPATVL